MHLFHKWSPWGKPIPVFEREKDTIPIGLAQHRWCSKCGKVEERRIL